MIKKTKKTTQKRIPIKKKQNFDFVFSYTYICTYACMYVWGGKINIGKLF